MAAYPTEELAGRPSFHHPAASPSGDGVAVSYGGSGRNELCLVDPETNESLCEERSPVTHVENLAAPLCIVHGVDDPRCPISQARLFRDALLDAGDFEYTELDGEGHGSTDG
jgi:dipeptidyl aminopeptidase/acylaminoacyl peptidase